MRAPKGAIACQVAVHHQRFRRVTREGSRRRLLIALFFHENVDRNHRPPPGGVCPGGPAGCLENGPARAARPGFDSPLLRHFTIIADFIGSPLAAFFFVLLTQMHIADLVEFLSMMSIFVR